MTETEISKKLCEALNKRPHTVVFKVHGHVMQRQGWPDFYLSCPQWRGWIETKNKDRQLDHYQKLVIADLLNASDSVYVLRFLSEKLFVIESFRNNETKIEKLFNFSTWPEAADRLVIALVELETRDGTRTATEL